MTDEMVTLVRELGFPIVVAGWFMFRSDRKQDKMLELLKEVTHVVNNNRDDIKNIRSDHARD